MNLKIKTSIIILLTLLIGILLGAIIDHTIITTRFQRQVVRMRSPEGFIRLMEHIIQPDAEQQQILRKIFIKRSQQLHGIGEKSRQEMETVMDSLKIEIEPILTSEQKTRLQRGIERLKEWRHKRPPFGRPRGNRQGHPMEPPPPDREFDEDF